MLPHMPGRLHSCRLIPVILGSGWQMERLAFRAYVQPVCTRADVYACRRQADRLGRRLRACMPEHLQKYLARPDFVAGDLVALDATKASSSGDGVVSADRTRILQP